MPFCWPREASAALLRQRRRSPEEQMLGQVAERIE